jgi:uncharacterized protein (TIGR03066 family)
MISSTTVIIWLEGICKLSLPESLIPKHVKDLRESNMKTKLKIAAIACVALFVFGCGSRQQDQIVGKWEAGESGAQLKAEFRKDGTAKLTMLGKTFQGTYKLKGDDLEWTMNGMTTRSKIKLSRTEMEVISDKGTIKYKRV